MSMFSFEEEAATPEGTLIRQKLAEFGQPPEDLSDEQILEVMNAVRQGGNPHPHHRFRSNAKDSAEILWIPDSPARLLVDATVSIITSFEGPLRGDIEALLVSIASTAGEVPDEDYKAHDGAVPFRLDDFLGIQMLLGSFVSAVTKAGAQREPSLMMMLFVIGAALSQIEETVSAQASAIVQKFRDSGELTDEDLAQASADADRVSNALFGVGGGDDDASAV